MAKLKLYVEGRRILLRKIRLLDVMDLYANMKDKEIGNWSLTPPREYSRNLIFRAVHGAYHLIRKIVDLICQLLCGSNIRKELKLGIFSKDTQRVIGVITLAKINHQSSCAEIGFWIGKNYRGKGLATEAVNLGVEFGFVELKLHRIYAWTFEKNTGSRKVMEKSGFKLEDVKREAAFDGNSKQDVLNYGILKSGFESV